MCREKKKRFPTGIGHLHCEHFGNKPQRNDGRMTSPFYSHTGHFVRWHNSPPLRLGCAQVLLSWFANVYSKHSTNTFLQNWKSVIRSFLPSVVIRVEHYVPIVGGETHDSSPKPLSVTHARAHKSYLSCSLLYVHHFTVSPHFHSWI